jgi:protein ImuB
MVAAVLIPRFALQAASPTGLGEAPAALAPAPGGAPLLGETSPAAEARGVHAGMGLGEALARCPELRLVAPDPARAAALWEASLCRLEGIGAAVESERAGAAFFAVEGLCGLYGGEVADVLATARAAIGVPVQIAAAPARLAAALAAGRREPPAGGDGEAVVPARALRGFLAPHRVGVLRGWLGASVAEQEKLIGTLERLGVGTLARLAALGEDRVADRFGALGLRALRLARGEDGPLRPRTPREELTAEIELPEGCAGAQLESALELLVERLLAAPERRGRTPLSLRLSASLCGGGSWSAEQGLGRPGASAQGIAALLASHLKTLPGPAGALRLRALALGPPGADQLELGLGEGGSRRGRLRRALREVRTAAGIDALVRLVELEPRSRLPERRFLLAPYREPRR